MPTYWAVVPAAGMGSRFEGELPKQYQSINGKYVIEYTLETLLKSSYIHKIIVAISPLDTIYQEIEIFKHPQIIKVIGGSTRMASVANGLTWIKNHVQSNDWVLVHDVARAALDCRDLNRLIEEVGENEIGGILGLPVRDTLKHVGQKNHIDHTVSRDFLWHAFTPQLFRFSLLYEALTQLKQDNIEVTDEAQMIEHLGLKPKMILSHYPNPKLTFQDDLIYFNYLLSLKKEWVE